MAGARTAKDSGDIYREVAKLREEVRKLKLHSFGEADPAAGGGGLAWASITWTVDADGSGPRDECRWAIDGTGPGAILYFSGSINVTAFTGTWVQLGSFSVDLSPYVDDGNIFNSMISVNVEDVVPAVNRYYPAVVKVLGNYPLATELGLYLYVDGEDLPNGGNVWLNGFVRLQGRA